MNSLPWRLRWFVGLASHRWVCPSMTKISSPSGVMYIETSTALCVRAGSIRRRSSSRTGRAWRRWSERGAVYSRVPAAARIGSDRVVNRLCKFSCGSASGRVFSPPTKQQQLCHLAKGLANQGDEPFDDRVIGGIVEQRDARIVHRFLGPPVGTHMLAHRAAVSVACAVSQGGVHGSPSTEASSRGP